MAHKKGVGSSDNGRDSNSKRLGVKLFGGQYAKAGNILIRQRGTEFHCGENTYLGKDFTVHARVDGIVTFSKGKNNRRWISVLPKLDEVQETVATITKAKPAAVSVTAAAPASVKADDLTKVEGIGPKIAELLSSNGINTFAALAAVSADTIQEILSEAGSKFAFHNSATWPAQADMAAKGEWDKLKVWQDELDGGREGKNEEE